jgi:hypothetical protein
LAVTPVPVIGALTERLPDVTAVIVRVVPEILPVPTNPPRLMVKELVLGAVTT